jgi:hypothetical protein
LSQAKKSSEQRRQLVSLLRWNVACKSDADVRRCFHRTRLSLREAAASRAMIGRHERTREIAETYAPLIRHQSIYLKGCSSRMLKKFGGGFFARQAKFL